MYNFYSAQFQTVASNALIIILKNQNEVLIIIMNDYNNNKIIVINEINNNSETLIISRY